MKKFSATTGGFYTPEIHGDNIPSDAVAISDEEYATLFSGQASGRIISSDADGNPVLIDASRPTSQELRAKELSALFKQWQADLTALQFAWVSALREDGESENLCKADISAEIEELQIQYQSDVAAVKLKYNEA